MLSRLEDIFSHLCQNQKTKLLEFGGESDHVHLLIDFFPDVAPLQSTCSTHFSWGLNPRMKCL